MAKRSRKPFRKNSIKKITVPNLSGLSRSQAQSVLNMLGINYAESTTTTSDSSLTSKVSSQNYNPGETLTIGSTLSFVYYNYVPAVVVTYGGCEAYGAGTNIGSGSYCDGTYTVSYTDYRYSARRAIYYNGSWDGSSYTTAGCSTVDSRSINSYTQINGSCGYTPPAPVISYGSCIVYQEFNFTGSECSGTYNRPVYTNVKEKRREIYSNGSATGTYDYNCTADTTTTYGSYSQTNGVCGYTTPAPACVCNYSTSDTSSIHFAPECCPGGSQRSGSLSGTTTNACCPNVSKSATGTYQCKAYDVNDPTSTNYYNCYSVGACSAPRNPDGSRSACYA